LSVIFVARRPEKERQTNNQTNTKEKMLLKKGIVYRDTQFPQKHRSPLTKTKFIYLLLGEGVNNKFKIQGIRERV
jgi:hypothetical protein